MAWETLPTWADGDALTAAQLLKISGNFNETAPAKATTAGGYFVATGTNAITQRLIQYNAITVTGATASTSYQDLTSGGTGPTISIVSGTSALIFLTAQLENVTTGGSVWASFDVGGATTTAAADAQAIMSEKPANQGTRAGVTTYLTLTPGTNHITMKYRVGSGDGSFDDRRLIGMPL